MLEFNIGLSALQAAQSALAVVGNNVTNANTPGYHRQSVQLVAQSPMVLNGQAYGRGVAVAAVQRAVNSQIESALTTQTTANGYTNSLQTTLTQLQGAIPTDSSSISSQLGTVFNDLQQVSSQVTNGTSSQVVISDATNLAQQFNSLSDTMIQMGNGLDQSIKQAVTTVNPLLQQIASLNTQIASETDQGASPNDLLDQRDQLVNTVAAQMPIEVQDAGQGQVTILQSGVPIVIGGQAEQLQIAKNKSGATTISTAKGITSPAVGTNSTANGPVPLQITSGQLGGLLDARNTDLPNYQNQLNSLAQQVSAAFDAVQSTGVGVGGGFTQLTGQRAVNDVTAPLNSAGLAFPPTAGTLTIGVTNTATGQRTMSQISIDPTTQSLKDVANAISTANPNVQAFVNSQAGTISLFAAPGYTIDFTGGIDATPKTSFSAGTTVTATTGGTYTGGTNDAYRFTFLSSGTVGVTSGLQAQITNQAGSVLGVVNLGQGYTAGQPITGPNGVTLTLSAGNVTAGDSLTTKVIGQPDTSGILTALGLNTFFTGNDAASIAVNPDLVANPSLLATSQTGQPGDTSNLQRFVAIQDAQLMGNGTQTLTQNFTQMVSNLGSQVSALNDQASTNQVLTTNLQNQQQSASGVSMNEEMTNLMKYQQMFQAASQYISAINTMLQQLAQSV